MTPNWRSLRTQLVALGFAAIVLPVLAVLLVSRVTEDTVTVDGVEVTEAARTRPSPWVAWTAIGLGPVAAGAAWWLAGRAVRPIEHVRRVAEDIEATDLSRRIDLGSGPEEVLALAAAFDGMLERLEHAADAQRRLIEEASHELRTPLAVLATNAEVLLAHPEPDVELYREGLVRSGEAVSRLQATIDELLVDARGRARTIARRPADLAEVVRAATVDPAVLAAERHVEIVLDLPDQPVAVAVDEATVRRAVGNVVANAVRFAPPGTRVDVRLRLEGAAAVVTVTDHGPGIRPEDQAQAFERFWRGSDGAGTETGTGLGLPIARQVARAHGGDVVITSPGPAGDGCEVAIRLRR